MGHVMKQSMADRCCLSDVIFGFECFEHETLLWLAVVSLLALVFS